MRASLAAGALFAINSKCLNLGGTVSLRKSRTLPYLPELLSSDVQLMPAA